MSAQSKGRSGPEPGSSGLRLNGEGSVKRARQLLEAGVRPARLSPPQPSRNLVSHQKQWPHPDSDLPLSPGSPRSRFSIPRSLTSQKLRRPSGGSSPSTSSEKTGEDSETKSGHANRPAQSFPHPQPRLQPPQRAPTNDGSSTSFLNTEDLAPRISIATEDLFRQSTASADSAPDVSKFPPPPGSSLQPHDPRRRTAGLVAPPNTRRPPQARRSSVSPIPEEHSDSRLTQGSFASSRAIPSSWGSGPPESYLDIDSDEDRSRRSFLDDGENLVRSASLGKRGKPTMRTIQKSNLTSDVSAPGPQRTAAEGESASGAATGAASQMPQLRSIVRQGLSPTASSVSSKGVDPEKPPIWQQDDRTYHAADEKEIDVFPRAAPAMSDNRPAGRKPPRLNMDAVRDAEARGSLSSLTDLIRRATKLASNLDHGKTASRTDVVGETLGDRSHTSGSLSDILASFPPPAPGASAPGHPGSWPVFFGREPLRFGEEGPGAFRKRRRCGVPRWLFILFGIVLLVAIILAVVLPVVLVAVPREKASTQSSCSDSTPCQNGGVSVSSGAQCSCVCSNGYTGSQCTIASDSSCVMSEINDSATAKNATMGSALPSLFEDSQKKFRIALDPVTIMALFSLNNASCKTENELVAFSEIDRSDVGNARRSTELSVDPVLADEEEDNSASPSISSDVPTQILVARSTATLNGILYDSSAPSVTAQARSAPDDTDSTSTTTSPTGPQTSLPPTSTSSAPPAPPAPSVPAEVVEFSQVAVLYILEKTGSFNSAQASETNIQSYLTGAYPNATHPSLQVLGTFALDFQNKTITLPGGTVAGE